MEVTTIEELIPEHFELVSCWLSNPDINRWLTAEWRGRIVTPTLMAMVLRNKRNRIFLVRHDDQPCGLTGLSDIDTADATAMVWYVLGEHALSRRGITTNALKQLARLSFNQMGLASLYAWIMEDNGPSERILQKAGFRKAGRIRAAASSGGCQVDRIYFDLVASEMSQFAQPSQ